MNDETASSEASTSALKLPSRKTYITALSTVAFISGLGIATVITIRRGRRMKLEEAQLQNSRSSHHKSAETIHRNTMPVKDESILGSASAKGPISLFKEMNRAAFGRSRQDAESESNYAIKKSRGTQAKASVFDSSAGVAPPSSLMRSSTKIKIDDRRVPSKSEEQEVVRHVQQVKGKNEDIGESPVLMAVKAIGIATALVSAGALVAWEIARRMLGVRDVDEFIDKLATSVPSKAKDKQALSGFRSTAKKSLNKKGSNTNEDHDETSDFNTEGSGEAPLPIHEALQALDDAANRGEAATWISILSRQLNAEREQDLEQRRQRRAKQLSNA